MNIYLCLLGLYSPEEVWCLKNLFKNQIKYFNATVRILQKDFWDVNITFDDKKRNQTSALFLSYEFIRKMNIMNAKKNRVII